MATKKLVPRANNEGGLGTAAKTWGASWLYNLTITNLQTTTSSSILVETSGNVEKRAYSTFLPNLTSLDEGVSLTTTTSSIDYVGAGITATASGNDVTVTVTGAAPVADTEDSTCWVGLYESATGNLLPKTDEQLYYDALNGTLWVGGTTNKDSLAINRDYITNYYNLLIKADNGGYLKFDSTLGHMFFEGGTFGPLADLSNTGLLIYNVPTESAPTHVLVDNIADPGLVSKMALSSLPTTLIAVADTNDSTCFVGLWEDATGNLSPKTDENITYDANANILYVPNVYAKGTVTGAASDLRLNAESAASGSSTDANGGNVRITGSWGTGAGKGGGIEFWGSKPTVSGTSSHTSIQLGLMYSEDGASTTFRMYEVGSQNDFFGIDVAPNGATELKSVDSSGALGATLLLKADGDLTIDANLHTTFKRAGVPMATIESLREREYMFALSDETSILTTGTKLTCRLPNTFTITQVFLNCSTAPTGAAIIVDITDDGTSIFDNGTNNGVRPSIAAGAKTNSGTGFAFAQGGAAATGACNIVSDSELVFEIDQVGSTVAGKGLKISFKGYNTI